MKLIPVENIPNRKYKAQKNIDIVREFIDSQLRCALVEGNGPKNLSSNLQEVIKKMGLKMRLEPAGGTERHTLYALTR